MANKCSCPRSGAGDLATDNRAHAKQCPQFGRRAQNYGKSGKRAGTRSWVSDAALDRLAESLGLTRTETTPNAIVEAAALALSKRADVSP